MALPNLTDLVLYVNKKLTGADWNTNWQKIVNWFTSGKTDIKVKSIELAQDGGIINNGSLTQSGDLTVDGNIAATGNLNVDGVISGDGSGLTGVVSAAQVSYTPFCVNSGFVNSNGNAGLFHYTAGVSTSIEFNVGDGTTYPPITFTTAKGKTTTLEAINSYDLSQTDNGTYLVYLTENATAVTLSDNGASIYRQPAPPTSPSATDIWLDTSKEGLTSYIRESGTWVEANIVVLGKVTVNNYKVQSATTYLFNWNGYNINIGDCENLQSSTQKPRVVIKTGSTSAGWYRIWSDGWKEQGGQATVNSTITLPTPFSDTNYNAVGTIYNNGANEAIAVYNKTKTQFSFGSENNTQCCWYAFGF